MSEEINYEPEVVVPKEEKLTYLANLASKQVLLEAAVIKAELRVESMKEEIKRLSENLIPDLMMEIGMSEFTLTDGTKIKVAPFYTATIDDTNRDACMRWLNQNGFGDIIKKQIVMDVGKLDGVDWKLLLSILDAALKEQIAEVDPENDVDIITSLKEGVHHQTLKAFLKEQITAGTKIPLDTFKAFIGKKTKITLN